MGDGQIARTSLAKCGYLAQTSKIEEVNNQRCTEIVVGSTDLPSASQGAPENIESWFILLRDQRGVGCIAKFGKLQSLPLFHG